MRETSRSEKKKVFFGRGGGTLFPLSPFGAITGLFSEPDENLVGLRGRKFLRSLGKKKKKERKRDELDRISRETDLCCVDLADERTEKWRNRGLSFHVISKLEDSPMFTIVFCEP